MSSRRFSGIGPSIPRLYVCRRRKDRPGSGERNSVVSKPPNLGSILSKSPGDKVYAMRISLLVAYELLDLCLSCRIMIGHEGAH